MSRIITIMHENKSVAEAMKWCIETSLLKRTECIIITGTESIHQHSLILVTDAHSFNLMFENNYHSPCPVLLLTSFNEDNQLVDALYHGVDAIADISQGPETAMQKILNLLENKPDETQLFLQKMVHAVRDQNIEQKQITDYGLTPKEKDILKLMREANHLKLISTLTNISYETVRTHVKNIYKKIGVSSASEAVLKAMKMNL